MTQRAVETVMSRPAVTVEASDSLLTAAGRMHRWRVGSVVVIGEGRPVGMLTERDVSRQAATGRPAGETSVGSWMSSPAVTVPRTATLHQAGSVMRDRGIRHLPVVEPDGQLAGVVSVRDLLACSLRSDGVDLPALVGEATAGPRTAGEGSFSDLESRWFHDVRGREGGPEDLVEFADQVDRLRRLPPDLLEAIPGVVRASRRLDGAVASVLSLLASRSERATELDDERLNLIQAGAMLPVIVGSVHAVWCGRDLDPSERAVGRQCEVMLAQVGANSETARANALDATLRIVALPEVDAAALAVSLQAAAGGSALDAVGMGVRSLSGATQLGGRLTALRAASVRDGRSPSDGDRRLPLMAGVLADLREVTGGVTVLPYTPTFVGHLAAIFDVLAIPAGLESSVLALGRICPWSSRYLNDSGLVAHGAVRAASVESSG